MIDTGTERSALFVTLEGIEGVGKSTHLAAVAAYLREHGHDVVVTREPGGAPVAEAIRDLLLGARGAAMSHDAELLLMFAARAEHLDKLVRPALVAGRTVVCDRFTDATYAYQGGGRGIDLARIAVLEDLIQAGLQPDLTLLLDAPVEVALARARARGGADRFELERSAFFERVRAVYLKRAMAAPHRTRIVDASGTPETVAALLIAALAELARR
ncbi:MAG: dTMP kinase [Gammaproteobacteria bacterium]|nr:dTMP kinase [Gammaproteobacteria bacterium]